MALYSRGVMYRLLSLSRFWADGRRLVQRDERVIDRSWEVGLCSPILTKDAIRRLSSDQFLTSTELQNGKASENRIFGPAVSPANS